MFSNRTLIGLIVGMLLLATGIRFFQAAKTKGKEQNLVTENRGPILDDKKSLLPEAAVSAVTPNVNEMAEAFVAKDSSLEERQKVRSLFRKGPIGNAMALLTFYQTDHPPQSKEEQWSQQAIQYLKQNPRESIEELSFALEKFPPEYQESRRLLLQLVAQYDIEVDLKVSLLKQELNFQKETKNPTEVTPLSVAITFDTLMDVTNDAGLLMDEMRSLQKKYQGTEAGIAAFSRYAARYPEQAKQLRREFK